MARKRRKQKAEPKRKPKFIAIHEHKLRPMIREAARAGLVEAIEHTSNFWNVSDGYRRYINDQIEAEAKALMAAVKTALREELLRTVVRSKLRKR